jgi:hypothetical protein
MNLRHAAALALMGWYLMMPPIGADRSINDDASISQWRITNSYDKASECEENRNAYKRMTADQAKAYHLALKESDTELVLMDMKMGVCIATDDPRLKSPVQFDLRPR